MKLELKIGFIIIWKIIEILVELKLLSINFLNLLMNLNLDINIVI